MADKRIYELGATATEAGLIAGKYFVMDGQGGPTHKLPANLVAPRSVQEKIIASLAPAFSTEVAYAEGDPVMHQGRLYRFITYKAAGEWDAAKVEETDVKMLLNQRATKQALNAETSRAVARENEIEAMFVQPTEEAVAAWLAAHPEATTTVQDSSLTEEKFSDALKLKAIKDYVTPEMFGAKGDGVTDDTAAIQAAINSVAGKKGTCVLFVSDSYAVHSDIFIPGHTTIRGCNRNQIYLFDNSSLVIGISSSWTYEVRISNLIIYGQNTSDYCIRNYTETSVITQCFIDNVYLDHALVAAIRVRCSIVFFNKLHVYYSAIGAKLRGNAIFFENSNFWDNTNTMHLDTTYSKFTNCWFEGGTGTLGVNNVQIRHESSCQAFFEGCCFQGSDATTQKIIWDTGDYANKSGSFFFIHCRINYPGATGGIFKVTTLSPNQMRLRFFQCYLYAPSGSFFIDNSEADISSFSYQANACGGIGRDMCSNETTKAISMDVSQDYRGVPHLLSGIVIGQKKPTVDAVINSEYEGYLRYDLSLHHLMLQSNGIQKTIPLRASTSIDRLTHGSGVTIDTLIDKINEMLVILGNEAGVLQYYTGV